MERNPKPAKKTFSQKEWNSKTDAGLHAKIYQEVWDWISNPVQRLCNPWPFQPVLCLLERTQHKKSYSKILSQLNWMSELNAWLCRKWVWQPSRYLRKFYEEKQKQFSLKHGVKWRFWREAGINEYNHTYVPLWRTRAMFRFRQYWPVWFPLHGMKDSSSKFAY